MYSWNDFINDFPYTNFSDINVSWFLNKFKQIFDEWEGLYNQMLSWKETTDEYNANWREEQEQAFTTWENNFQNAIDTWKEQTESDINEWETDTLANLETWKTTFIAQYNALKAEVEQIAEDAETAKNSAQLSAQNAANSANSASATALALQASLEQIQTNTNNIDDLETQLTHKAPKEFSLEDVEFTMEQGIIKSNLTVYIQSESYTGRHTAITVNAGEIYVIGGRSVGTEGTGAYYPCAFITDGTNTDILIGGSNIDIDSESVIIPYDGTLYINGFVSPSPLHRISVKKVVWETDEEYYEKLAMLRENSHKKYCVKKYADNEIRIKWKSNGKILMLIMAHTGGNLLYGLKELYVFSEKSLEDFETENYIDLWTMGGTDWFGPYKVEAINNIDGDNPDSNNFTGGNHRTTNTAVGGGITATELNLNIYIDGKTLNDNNFREADSVKIYIENGINGYNTSKADGSGRNIIKEKWEVLFNDTLKVYNNIVALESVIIKLYYGIQAYMPSNIPNFVYMGNNRTIYNRGEGSNSGDKTTRTAKIYSSNFVLEMTIKNRDLGDFSHNNYTYSLFSTNANKVYTALINQNLALNTGENAFLEGEYNFSA